MRSPVCRRRLLARGTFLAGLWLSGCGSSQPSAAGRPVPAAAPARAGQAAAPAAGTAAPLPADNPVLLTPPSAGGAGGAASSMPDVCKATSVEAEQVPVDVFMMVDQSLSMLDPDASGNTRWGSVIDALTQFVQSKQSEGLGVGLQYFGLSLAGVSCNPSDYAVPEVEIGALPGNAQALVTSFGQHIPSSVTPTAPALQGAIEHAAAYRMQHPTHVVVVLLVTDGEPDFCGLLGETVDAARAGHDATPAISTYVLGVGAALDALDQIAQAGGSQHAYIVDGAQDVSAKVLLALDQIRSSVALPCELLAPQPEPGTPFDPSKVNLSYTPSGGAEMLLPYTADATRCDSAPLAWRYDDPAAPTKLLLGAQTCKTVTSAGGKLGVSLRCPTVELK